MSLVTRFSIRIPYFDLRLLALSHGWINLPPFKWDDKNNRIVRYDSLDGLLIKSIVKQTGEQVLVYCYAEKKLPNKQRDNLKQRIYYMLSADIDPSAFIALAEGLDSTVYKFAQKGGARFLRGTTLFEDVVKTLFTTNASWDFTRLMCENVIAICADKSIIGNGDGYFPSYNELRRVSSTTLTHKCRLGYRAEYLKNIVDSFISHKGFENWPADEALIALSKIRGLGPYSINHIGMLLGDYRNIPVDCEVTSYLEGIGLPSDVKGIQEYYKPWHPYEFLAYKIQRRIAKTNWIGD